MSEGSPPSRVLDRDHPIYKIATELGDKAGIEILGIEIEDHPYFENASVHPFVNNLGKRGASITFTGNPLTDSTDEDALRAAIGHELGHMDTIRSGYFVKQFAYASEKYYKGLAKISASTGVIAGALENPTTRLMLGASAVSLMAAHGIRFAAMKLRQTNEYIADNFSVELSGRDVGISGMKKFFAGIESNTPKPDIRPESLKDRWIMAKGTLHRIFNKTHPDDKDRIDALERAFPLAASGNPTQTAPSQELNLQNARRDNPRMPV